MTVTAVEGFVASGLSCGIKSEGRQDLALVATTDGSPVTAAGVFTTNRMTAAPVQVCRDHLSATGGRATGVVLNSGNANAATGAAGLADAERMCEITAEALGCSPDEVLVCSTGWIGYPLPMDAITTGIGRATVRDYRTWRQRGPFSVLVWQRKCALLKLPNAVQVILHAPLGGGAEGRVWSGVKAVLIDNRI